ncbi:hypothetical protein NADE_009226 [Nannochloris sp. 'desiccata']|nr:hypothetical protein KSW81_006020 [Chlorella desiccata (nom. nud.)]KAH7621178.1 hypothetical protein NADE_009226 [Chlorella desiccata (nom. nud.)]
MRFLIPVVAVYLYMVVHSVEANLTPGYYKIQSIDGGPCNGRFLSYKSKAKEYPGLVSLQAQNLINQASLWDVQSRNSKDESIYTFSAVDRAKCCPAKLGSSPDCKSGKVHVAKSGALTWTLIAVSARQGTYTIVLESRDKCPSKNAKKYLGPVRSGTTCSKTLSLFAAATGKKRPVFKLIPAFSPPTPPPPPVPEVVVNVPEVQFVLLFPTLTPEDFTPELLGTICQALTSSINYPPENLECSFQYAIAAAGARRRRSLLQETPASNGTVASGTITFLVDSAEGTGNLSLDEVQATATQFTATLQEPEQINQILVEVGPVTTLKVEEVQNEVSVPETPSPPSPPLPPGVPVPSPPSPTPLFFPPTPLSFPPLAPISSPPSSPSPDPLPLPSPSPESGPVIETVSPTPEAPSPTPVPVPIPVPVPVPVPSPSPPPPLPPPPPNNVQTFPVSEQALLRLVTWTATADVLSYTVRCQTSPGDSAAARETTASASTLQATIGTGSTQPLVPGKVYICSVAASNAAGLGLFAPSTPFEVPPPAPTGVTTSPAPGQPLHRTVEWIAPVPCNGCTFKVECTPTTGTKVIATAASSPVTIEGFSSSETYTCRVRATTIISGPGPWSLDSSEFTTAQLLERSTAVGYPIPPAGATTPEQTLGFWRLDRTAPAVWNEAGISFEGKENVLQTGIVEADLKSTSFYNTQGRVYAYGATVTPGSIWTISGNVFIPQAFKDDVDPTDSTTWRKFSIWASLFNPINYSDQGYFAISGFSNVPSDDTPAVADPAVNPQQYVHFWEWNPTVGTKTLSPDDHPILINQWNTFSAEVSVGATTEFKYYFNGKLAGTYSVTSPSTTTTQLQVFIQTVNPCSGFSGIPATYCNKDTATNPENKCCKGATYDVHWADINAFLL